MSQKGVRKGYTAKYRLFSGKTFTRAFHFATKTEANRYAKEQRARGSQVRVVKEVGGYITYKRNPVYA